MAKAHWRFLATGDSWFGLDPKQSAVTSLLHALSFRFPTWALDCTPPFGALSLASDLVANEDLLAGLMRHERWDGLLLSFGGDDLLAAVGTPAAQTDGRPVAPDKRLLLSAPEWQGSEPGVLRYVSQSGFETLAQYLRANLERLVEVRDHGPSRGCPVFIHGYADPVPRPAPMSSGIGPWLQPAFAAYGIPIEHHLPLAQALYGLLRDALLVLTHDKQRCPNVHLFDPSGVTLARAGANQAREHGDWLTEAHPSAAGYQRLADAWSEQIEAILSARTAA